VEAGFTGAEHCLGLLPRGDVPHDLQDHQAFVHLDHLQTALDAYLAPVTDGVLQLTQPAEQA
jgi:hypothetical protein